jgi:serine O-acetyltransferase
VTGRRPGRRAATLDRVLGPDWVADRARWPAGPWRLNPAIWAVAVHRFGNRAEHWTGLRGKLARRLEPWLHLATRLLLGIEIPRQTRIGPGLLIWHQGPITINWRVRIGRNCTLQQGVTIGAQRPGGAVPVIGDDVYIGAGGRVLGDVRVGDGARVGAAALVLEDVPAGHTAVGVPARMIPPRAPG